MNKSKLVQQTIAARKRVRNLAITLLPNDTCSVINMSTYKAPALRKEDAVRIVNDFTGYKHNWSALLIVFGRCPVQGRYWKTLDVAPDGKFYSSQINEALSHHHEKLVESFNTKHFVSLGWIARPSDGLFDNDKLYDMFNELDAWDYLAEWETAE